MFEQINQNVCKRVVLTTEELSIFNGLLVAKSVPKKSFLLRAGEICNFESYVVKGCTKTYYIDKDGNEVIISFGLEDWWLGDVASFYEQKPSSMFIETLEDCEILTLSPQHKEELLIKAPRFERVFRLMIQRHLANYQTRLFGSFANTAEERYLDFLEKYPTLSQRIPQHLIAHYLGISPEFLSKTRTKLLRK